MSDIFNQTLFRKKLVSENRQTQRMNHTLPRVNTFSLPTCQMRQLGQWPYASDYNTLHTPPLSVLHLHITIIHMQSLVRFQNKAFWQAVYILRLIRMVGWLLLLSNGHSLVRFSITYWPGSWRLVTWPDLRPDDLNDISLVILCYQLVVL